MNHSVHFTIPDHTSVAAQKAQAVIEELGAPLKSDSGHFITGAIPHPGGSIEVLISWLPAGDGTQITVQTTGEDRFGNAIFRTAERVRDTYLKQGHLKAVSSRGGVNMSAILVVLSLFLVMGLFFFIMTRH
ncbi:MAG TPA: hypothetical protein VKU00_17250 [Chthonomonadaceae bacterium]|nr:hypothetical protein [Chthonomonadaceae bacterium]